MHSFILKNEEPPVCVTCNTIITIKHTLINCADLVAVRKNCFEERPSYILFRDVNPEKNFDFLREFGVFCKI